MRTPGRLASAERVFLQIVRMRHVVHTEQHIAVDLAVGRNTAHGNAAEACPVISAFTTDQYVALAFAARAVVGKCNLQCGVHALGTRIAIEHVIEVTGRHRGQSLGDAEGIGMTHLKCRCVIHLGDLFLYGFDDARAAMTCIDTPKT